MVQYYFHFSSMLYVQHKGAQERNSNFDEWLGRRSTRLDATSGEREREGGRYGESTVVQRTVGREGILTVAAPRPKIPSHFILFFRSTDAIRVL